MDNLEQISAMTQKSVDKLVENADGLHDAALDASRYLHEKILESEENRELADKLHGTWLGHPLHPVLTDLTIGGWTFGLFFDLLAFFTRSKGARTAGDFLTILGTASAVPTAITGLADYSAIKKDAASYGALHGVINGVVFFLYVRSIMARLSGRRGSSLILSVAAMTLGTFSAWLGGDMIYRHRVGVNHNLETGPEAWTAVMPLDRLKEETLTRGMAKGTPILLYRTGDTVHAIGAVCSHAGGPLEDGQIVKNMCVECPWHQSVFDLRTGRVVHGPSTFNQPYYEVRIRDGQIDVRAASPDEEHDVRYDQTMYNAPASQPEVMKDQRQSEARERLEDRPDKA